MSKTEDAPKPKQLAPDGDEYNNGARGQSSIDMPREQQREIVQKLLESSTLPTHANRAGWTRKAMRGEKED